MNIYKQEFRMHVKSVITWSLSLAALILVFMSLYPSFGAEAELLNEMMDKFPRELLIAFGMDGVDMSTVLGFYGLIFLFCQVILAIQAANYGFSILSVEERDLTADFLLAKPVSRTKILTTKLLSAITGLLITDAVVWASSFALITAFRGDKPYDTKALLLLLLSIIVFQSFFLTVGMVISLLVKRVRNVTPYAMALAFGMYVLSAFGGMLGEDKLEIISPFKHFDANRIVSSGSWDWPLVMITVACIVISVVGSYWLYTRRDIRSAV
jgi:ABC-2 type transport system permease protein